MLPCMRKKAPLIIASAMALHEKDRAAGAAVILEGLKPPAVLDADSGAFRVEIERRADRVRRGEAEWIAWDDAHIALRSNQSEP